MATYFATRYLHFNRKLIDMVDLVDGKKYTLLGRKVHSK